MAADLCKKGSRRDVGVLTASPYSRACGLPWRTGASALRLVTEVTDAGEDHGYHQAVGGFNHVVVAYRAARLDHCADAELRRFLDPVGEGEECVRRHDTTFHGEHGLRAGQLHRIDAAHLPGANAHKLP